MRERSDQTKGGTLTIPDGYFVNNVDLDAEVPTCTVVYEGNDDKPDIILEIPRSLAYYLTTHHNGSIKFRDRLQRSARNALKREIKELLEDEE